MTGFSILRRLLSREDGNVAVIFALATVPLLAFTGAAIDYGLALRLQTKLQSATDATALLLCQTADGTDQGVLWSTAQNDIADYMGSTSAKVDNPLGYQASAPGVARQITITSRIPSSTFFSAFTSVSKMNVKASSQCSTPVPKNFEIALVLDNTGSMSESSNGQTKIAALQTAATNFVEYVYGNTAFSSATKIAIVPFSGAVTVKDPRVIGDYTSTNANWIDWAGKSSLHWENINKAQATTGNARNLANRQAIFDWLDTLNPTPATYPYTGWNWGGCLETPQYPQNVRDVSVDPSDPNTLYQQYFAPDEPGSGTSSANPSAYMNNSSWYVWNDYLADSNCQGLTSTAYLAAESRGCKYGAATKSTVAPRSSTSFSGYEFGQNGPNWGCNSAPMQRLLAVKTGTNKKTLENLINIMSARGSTNIHEGFMWGWRAISPNSVLADGALYNTASTPPAQAVTKVIILMTDGMNDWLNLLSNSSSSANGAMYNALGYPTNSTTGDAAGTSPNDHLQSNHQTPVISSGTNNIWNPASNSGRSAIDGLLAEACTNAKAAPANVSVYTIAFSIASDPIDTTGQNLLKNCASSGQYFLANDSNGLIAAFGKIASSIGALRISQ